MPSNNDAERHLQLKPKKIACGRMGMATSKWAKGTHAPYRTWSAAIPARAAAAFSGGTQVG